MERRPRRNIRAGLMAFLFAASAASAACSLVYGFWLTHRETSLVRGAVKTLATILLAVIAWLVSAPTLLIIALLLGALGDACLARKHPSGFIPGLASFLLGHLAYVFLLIAAGSGPAVILSDIWRIIAAMSLALTAIWLLKQLWSRLGPLLPAVVLYVAVSIAVGMAALTLPTNWPIGLALPGAAAFIASDIILSQQLFVLTPGHPLHRPASTLLWFLYWGGQSLLLAAFVV